MPKLELIYLVITELEVESSALYRKENKEEKGDFEGKVYAPHSGLLIALPPFLSLGLERLQVDKDLEIPSPLNPCVNVTIGPIRTKALMWVGRLPCEICST